MPATDAAIGESSAPLALAAVASWLLVALAGYCAAAVRLGEALRQMLGRDGEPLRLGTRLASTLAALLLLRMLQAIPVVGAAVTLSALVFGSGAVARAAQLLHLRARARLAGPSLNREPPGPAPA